MSHRKTKLGREEKIKIKFIIVNRPILTDTFLKSKSKNIPEKKYKIEKIGTHS